MAEDSEKSLFRKSALNRIASADDLDKALKVSNPSAWMSISAFLAFAIGITVNHTYHMRLPFGDDGRKHPIMYEIVRAS
jgi:hypothetical protein